MELPVDIMLDILTRLLTESVLESKLVSKTWRDVIRHPSFSKKHSNRLLSVAGDSGNLGFILSNYFDSEKAYYVEYSENNDTPIIRTRRVSLPPEFNCYTFVGFCNGLICLQNIGVFIIWNPITKEHVFLSGFTLKCQYYGFGYLASTNEYKVVRINDPEPNSPDSLEIEVYTLGSGNGWKNVGKLNSRISSARIGALANGALHWIARGKERRIMSFDLVDEKIRENSLPTLSRSTNRDVILNLVGALGDILMCVNYLRDKSDRSLDIWLFKENGTYDMNWQVYFKSISCSEEFNLGDMEPFAITNSGAVLCFIASHTNTTICRYDLKSSSVKMLVSLDKEFHLSPFSHMKSLVSLKALGEENTIIPQLKIVFSGDACQP
ncbi:F-box protein At3g07870-like [Papaver somniferum]|uniref:F-box protein At3g07870-like n=1 Tax=Papaver somniferum TaxID=3469 RepID=UPI000E705182|nr:F-box protein At3g07870-like [Papaver somniferum]